MPKSRQKSPGQNLPSHKSPGSKEKRKRRPCQRQQLSSQHADHKSTPKTLPCSRQHLRLKAVAHTARNPRRHDESLVRGHGVLFQPLYSDSRRLDSNYPELIFRSKGPRLRDRRSPSRPNVRPPRADKDKALELKHAVLNCG